jgi:CrcB protein
MPPSDRNDITARQASVDPDLFPTRGRAGRRLSRARPAILVAVALGGALGSPARYAIGRLVPTGGGGFPWATFLVNVSGSLVLGALLTLIVERWPPTRYARPFAAIGFLGAYTTFSTSMVETDLLVKDGHVAVALAYTAGSLAVGLLAAYVGIISIRILPTTRGAPR